MGDSEQPVGERTRDEAVERLCEAFAADALPVEEFERRIELAHRVETVPELRELLQDLPRSGETRLAARESGADSESGATPAHRHGTASRSASLEGLHVPEHALIMGALGGASRKGRWVPARKTKAFGILGGVELDLREASLPPGVTEIQCFAFWGGVEIVVPPDVAVECDGIGIMGGFEHRHEAQLLTDPDAPVIRIRGIAIMGGVDVSARYAGESARDARRRIRLEKKEQRRLRGGRD